MFKNTIKSRLKSILEMDSKIELTPKTQDYLSFQLRNFKHELTLNNTNVDFFSNLPSYYGQMLMSMRYYELNICLSPQQLEACEGSFDVPEREKDFNLILANEVVPTFPNDVVNSNEGFSNLALLHMYANASKDTKRISARAMCELLDYGPNLIPILNSIHMRDAVKAAFDAKRYLKIVPQKIIQNEDALQIEYVANIRRVISIYKLRPMSPQINAMVDSGHKINEVLAAFKFVADLFRYVPFRLTVKYDMKDLQND